MNFFRNNEFLLPQQHGLEMPARKPEAEDCEFLTKQEAAAFLNCGVRSIDKWRQHAGLPSVRIGNFVRFERAALIEWMRKHTEVKGMGMSQQAESREGERK